MRKLMISTLVGGALLAGCGGDDPGGASPGGNAATPATTSTPAVAAAAGGGTRFPDVRKATLTPTGDGVYTLSVTVSSPYDTPQRYADGWRVLGAGTNTVLGRHSLDHDHASEQPFVREQAGLKIPADVTSVTVEGRDKANGYGGKTVTVAVPR